MDHLVCPEINILKAVKSWATETCESKYFEASPENMKSELGDCVALIRFLVMTADQLTRCCEIYPQFLENSDFADVSQYIMHKRKLIVAKRFSTVPRGSTIIDAFF